MTEYRYHRIAPNDDNWTKPSPGRLSAAPTADYVGANGFGHEDWNFAKDLWADGLCHLYVRAEPARADREKTFNIALGVQTQSYGHCVVAFCENVQYKISSLSDDLIERRALQLHRLDKAGSLGGRLKGLSVERKATALLEDGEVYWLAAKPSNIRILDHPLPIPREIVKPNHNRYQLVRLGADQYNRLKENADLESPNEVADNQAFPEGRIVERVHRARERSVRVVELAKSQFRGVHGHLHCEACGFEPGARFPGSSFENSLIEAHHDVPLASHDHSGQTNPNDLRMLCPTCHRAIHKIRPWLSTDEFRRRFFSESH